MHATRRLVVLASLAILAACGGDNPLVPSGTTLTIQGGNNQSVQLSGSTPLAVLVTDGTGAPESGVNVTWTVVSGGGSITAAAPSGADGVASATYTAGTTSGQKTIRASVAGAADSVDFTLTVLSGIAKRLVKAAGDLQQTSPSTPIMIPLKVQVVDTFGNGVSGFPVLFTLQSGGGALGTTTTTTDAAGYATSSYVSGPTPSSVSVQVSAAGLLASPASFSITVNAGGTLVKSIPYNTTFVHDQFVRGGILFVCAWERMDIYDVGGASGGTPANPAPLGSITTATNGVSGGAQMHNVWWYWSPEANIGKRYAFVGQEGPAVGGIGVGSSGDIHVVDISNMSSPVEVAYYHMAGLGAPRDSAGTHNFWVDETNKVLYAAYYNGGVVAINIAGPLQGNLSSREIARIRPGGLGNTFVWGVMQYQGSLYATDMLSGFWQLKLGPNGFSVAGGGDNVPERFGSDQWVANGYAYTGTWGTRVSNGAAHSGNTVKIWHLDGAGAPALVDSIVTPGIGTVSDVEVSADNRMLVFSAEGGVGAGIYFYSLVGSPAHPTFIGRYQVPTGAHTATIADIGGKRYVFAAKDPSGPAELIVDVTAISP